MRPPRPESGRPATAFCVWRPHLRAAALLLAVAALWLPGAASAQRSEPEYPSVVRPRFLLGSEWKGQGTAFFIEADVETGAVGVAAAHNFDLAELSQARDLRFVLGRTGKPVGASSGLYTDPGRSFSDPGASMRDDFVIFALDAPPVGVKPLPVADRPGKLVGQRVRILGVPAAIPQDEDDIFGTVSEVSAEQIVVELDTKVDLRGWGGAPVQRWPGGEVIGLLQAAWPEGGLLRLGVGPIGGVLDAMQRPLNGGLGQAFASFRPAAPLPDLTREDAPLPAPPSRQARTRPRPEAPAPASGSEPAGAQPSPTSAPPARETLPWEDAAAEAQGQAAPPPQGQATPPRAGTGDPAVENPAWEEGPAEGRTEAKSPPEPTPAPDDPSQDRAYAISAVRNEPGPGEDETLLGRAGAVETNVTVQIEEPADGVVIGDSMGVFVAGRALASLGDFRRFDVMLVLDTSGSTAAMSGADINGNGVVGQGRLGNLFGGAFGGTDAGDSILAAEVAAAHQILKSLDARNTRVGLVSFAGQPDQAQGGLVFQVGGGRPDAIVEEPLTDDFTRIQAALDHVLLRGPEGLTNMAEAVDKSYEELFGFRGSVSDVDRESEKVVLFFTDGQPTGPYDARAEAYNVQAVLRAAQRAARLGVRIHTFAIGPEALEGPVATVEMAARTGGYFTPVRNPGDLVAVIENVNLTNIQSVEVRNLSTDEPASESAHTADGSFSALVPMQVGANRIEVVATTADGGEARQELIVNYAPDAPGADIPRDLMAARNQLLEQRLLDLRQERLGIERDAVDKMRKDLQLDIQRERAAAESRAERQRKLLELEPERLDADANEPEPPADSAPFGG